MSDLDIERIDEIVTDVSVWIGRTAVGAMEDLYERDALIELQRLGKLSKDLVAELAAIRDARDDEVDDICRPYVSQHFQHIIENDEYMRDIAKARGLKIAEQAAKLKSVANERDYFWKFYVDEHREYEHAVSEFQRVMTERDEAIGLLKWCRDQGYLNVWKWFGEPRPPEHVRILELTAKREEK